MTRGLNGLDEKKRREQRRHNHIAKDLRSPKYKMRTVEEKRKDKYKFEYIPDDE